MEATAWRSPERSMVGVCTRRAFPYTSTTLTLWAELIIVLVVLKVPCFYVFWVLWWSIKAEPELGAEGGTEGINWRPWRPPSASSNKPGGRIGRDGYARSRGRVGARAVRREARMSESRP